MIGGCQMNGIQIVSSQPSRRQGSPIALGNASQLQAFSNNGG
jgi:hypothetical protein